MASHGISASPVPTYIIYRDVTEGQPYDPTATLTFFPAKDSDELFDALRAKYPHLKSHSERMRDATIEFLLEERAAEALSANVSPAMPSLYDSMNDASPFQQSWPSASMTTLSSPDCSPDMTNFTTPTFGNSPQPQIPNFVQQQSSSATPSDSHTPAINQMTSVFSLSTSEQPKQRVRRKMTEAEKVEYRKRRIVKACDKCSKRKRKCVHNQPAIEGLKTVNDKPTTKVSKPRHNASKQLQHAETALAFNLTDSSLIGDGLVGGFEHGGYEDFTLMFDDPTLDFSFDEFMPFDPLNFDTQQNNYRQGVQHSDANGVPCDPRASRNSSSSDSSEHDSFFNHTEDTISADNFVDLMIPHGSQIVNNPRSRDRYTPQASNGASLDAGQLEELGPAYSPGGHNLPLQPTHTAHTHEMQSPSGSAHTSGSSGGGSSSDGCLDRSTSGFVSFSHRSVREMLLGDTALSRSRESAASVARSPAGATPESNALLRHRLRSASAQQSEMSSTSVTSSSSIPGSPDAAILEGRPAASIGNRSSLQTSLGCEMHGELAAKRSTRPTHSTLPISPLSGDTRVVQSSGLDAASSRTRALAPLSSLQTRDASARLTCTVPFDSIDNGHAWSTELFRVKNRMPAWHDDSVPTANSTTASSGQSAQANGGAYPRLENTTTTTTATRNSLTALATLQQNRAEKAPMATSIAKSIRNATGAAAARMLFTESETQREKDHHGRSTSSVRTIAATAKANPAHTTILIALAVLAIVVLTLMLMPTSNRPHHATYHPISILPIGGLQHLAANNESARSRLSRVLTVSRQRKQQMTSSFGMIASLQLLGCM